ncbi:hypothetical protein M5K25_023749 [Dendrobium thyrsiflorum]|uniref:Uncharacterized protein n=1 Tax=Dendrobium thyrsiflorum TaxID=117978 RepID=A0ABD0U0H5_DENTH
MGLTVQLNYHLNADQMAQNCPALMSRSRRSAFSVPGSSLKSSLNMEYALQKEQVFCVRYQWKISDDKEGNRDVITDTLTSAGTRIRKGRTGPTVLTVISTSVSSPAIEIPALPNKLLAGQTYSQTERLGITNPTTPRSAQSEPNQGLKALLEGSNRNLDYQTVSKFDNLIVESSDSTRRVQRAQERRNPTSLSQKIVHRTVYDQGIHYRPSSPISSSKGTQSQSLKRSRERSKTALAPLLLLDHRRSSAEPPPDHRLKALHSAGPPPKGPTALQSAGPPTEGPTLHSRTDILPKARLAAQGPTSCSRLDVLPKARLSAQGLTCCSRPDVLLKARRSAQGLTFCSRPDILPKA